MIKINISKDFSNTPGGRKIVEGKFSGEEFRDTILSLKYQEAKEKNEMLEIDFDGCFGFATSFLEEAFGGLVRETGEVGILDRIVIISNDDETLEETVKRYITEAEKNL